MITTVNIIYCTLYTSVQLDCMITKIAQLAIYLATLVSSEPSLEYLALTDYAHSSHTRSRSGMAVLRS